MKKPLPTKFDFSESPYRERIGKIENNRESDFSIEIVTLGTSRTASHDRADYSGEHLPISINGVSPPRSSPLLSATPGVNVETK